MPRIISFTAVISLLIVLGFVGIVMAMICAVIAPDLAYAAGTAPQDGWTGLSAILMPYFMEAVAGLLGLILIYLSSLARQWLGLKISEKDRQTLHSAALTGLRSAIQARSSDPIGDAVEYVMGQGAPEAVKRLKASSDTVAEIAKSKMSLV